MNAEPEPAAEKCPRCQTIVSPDAEVCATCRGRLTVDVCVPHLLADGRVRYLAARSLAALGRPMPELRELQNALQQPGGVLVHGVTRAFAGRVLGVLGAHAVTGVLRPAQTHAAAAAVLSRLLDRTVPLGAHRVLLRLARKHPLLVSGGAMGVLAFLLTLAIWVQGPRDLTPEEIGRRGLPAMAVLRCKDSIGSGFFVGKERLLTNAHVICPGVQVNSGQNTYSAEILKSDEDIDLALLRVPGATAPSLPLGDATKVQVGESVVLLGSPKGLGDSLQLGTISHGSRGILGVAYVQVDANVNPGNSGGPLIDRKGRVIGVVSLAYSGAKGIGFALPINYATHKSAFLPGRAVRDWRGLTRREVLLFEEWVDRARREDAQEADKIRSSMDRPMLVSVVPGPGTGAGRSPVAVLVQRSGLQPGPIERTFRISRNGLRICEGKASVLEWVRPGSDGGREPLYLRWLRRHGLDQGLYIGVAHVQAARCTFDAVVGGELVMENETGEVDRVSIDPEM